MGIPVAIAENDNNPLTELYFGTGGLFEKQLQFDSAFFMRKKMMEARISLHSPHDMVRASMLLSSLYAKRNAGDSAYKYLLLAGEIKDTVFTREKLKYQQMPVFEESKRQEEKSIENTRKKKSSNI